MLRVSKTGISVKLDLHVVVICIDQNKWFLLTIKNIPYFFKELSANLLLVDVTFLFRSLPHCLT